MEPNCADCVYSEIEMGDDQSVLLFCKRTPPTIFTLYEEPAQTRPTMRADDWCGEFIHKDKELRRVDSAGRPIPWWW